MRCNMQEKGGNRIRLTDKMVWIGIGLGTLFWILESFIHFYIFRKGTLINQILPTDPDEIWMRIIVVASFTGFGVYCQVIIGKRKRAEKAMRQREEWLSATLNSVGDGLVAMKMDGRVTRINPVAEMLTGWSLAEAKGRPIHEVCRLVNAETRETMQSPVRRVLDAGVRVVTTDGTALVSRGGVAYPVEVNCTPIVNHQGEITGAVMVFRDMTGKRQAEQALRESEQKFRLMSESSLVGLAIFQEDRIKYVNMAMAKIYGYPRKRLLSWTATDFLRHTHPEDVAFVKEQLHKKQTGESEGVVPCYQYRAVAKMNDIKSLEIFSKTIAYQGKPADFLTLVDITDLKRAEKALRNSQEQLFQAQKMKALGTLVAGVAHEINNPVNLIMFNSPLFLDIWQDFQPILKEHADKEPTRLYGGLTYDYLKENLEGLLSDVNMAANRIARIVKDLKNFSRQSDVVDKEPVQINTAVENAVRMAQTTLSKTGVELEFDLARELPLIEGNLQSIEQIVLNITINAIDAITHEHGRIKIATGRQEKDGRVFMAISDNGRGIDPSISATLFDPFVTDKQAQGGTGLGLSVTYSLVKSHGGEIAFKSQKENGSVFTVFFPAMKKENKKYAIHS